VRLAKRRRSALFGPGRIGPIKLVRCLKVLAALASEAVEEARKGLSVLASWVLSGTPSSCISARYRQSCGNSVPDFALGFSFAGEVSFARSLTFFLTPTPTFQPYRWLQNSIWDPIDRLVLVVTRATARAQKIPADFGSDGAMPCPLGKYCFPSLFSST
jgi:hypothetical protein